MNRGVNFDRLLLTHAYFEINEGVNKTLIIINAPLPVTLIVIVKYAGVNHKEALTCKRT